MSEDPEMSKHSKIKRRDFVSAAALPLGAGVVPASLTAQDNAAFSAPERVRVGIIGAGANVRGVQIPGFQRISGCEIVAVANRSLQSSQRVTKEFNIPTQKRQPAVLFTAVLPTHSIAGRARTYRPTPSCSVHCPF